MPPLAVVMPDASKHFIINVEERGGPCFSSLTASSEFVFSFDL